jgi:hypothetical protein
MRLRGSGFLLFLALLLGATSVAQGQLVRGPEILINGKTSGAQTDPDVAIMANGDFIVVWVDGRAPGTPANVMARLFASNGTPRTGDLRVSASEPDFQEHPRVAVDAAGDFVVVWSSRLFEQGRARVYGRRFRADGQPLGQRFRLGKGQGRAQSEPDVARAPDGRFVVAWSELDGGISDPYFQIPTNDIFVRRFSAQGAPKGVELRIGGRDFQYNPALAINQAGDFVVAYTDEVGDPDVEDLDDVHVRRFSRDGRPLASARILAETEFDWLFHESRPAVALADDGALVLAWFGDHESEPVHALWARRFGPNGRPQGHGFRLTSTIAPPMPIPPAIGLAADGSFVVAWTGMQDTDGDGLGVFARRFERDGSPSTPETQLAQSTAGEQRDPHLAVAPDGRGVVVWQSEGRDGDSYGISGRRLRDPEF